MVLHPHQLTPALPKIQRLHWTLCPNGQSCLDYSPTSQEQPWPSPVVLAHNPHLMQPAQPNGILSEKTAGRNFAVVLHVKNEVPFSYRLKGLISQSCAWLKTTKDEVTAARKVKRCLASVASATIARSIKTFFFLFCLFFFFLSDATRPKPSLVNKSGRHMEKNARFSVTQIQYAILNVP